MIYNRVMKYLLSIISVFILFKTAASKTLLFDTYGFYNYEKVYSLSGDRKYIVYSNHGVVLTDLGITGETDCHGVQDFEKGKSLEQNIMCLYRERNGDTAYFHFKNINGEEEARTNGFNILSGTGRWKFLIGQKCIGATARISDFKEGTNNAAFEWKGKCNIPDDKYSKFKNYIKN